MITITQRTDFQFDYLLPLPASEVAFFDIETTGFSPEKTFLYMIGYGYFTDNQWFITQWMAESLSDEKLILEEFMTNIKKHKLLISFNGLGFDTNYLKKKCDIHNTECNLNTSKHLDIYRIIKPFKNIFKLENLKQKTLEKFLEINREDIYSGKDLIKIYNEYLKTGSEKLKDTLLLHNKNDMEGMFSIFCLMNYIQFFEGDFNIEKAYTETNKSYNNKDINEAFIVLSFAKGFPQKISYCKEPFYFTAAKTTATLRIRLTNNELKYFFSDYKNYYYLPKEDMAIHKSLASFVDKQYRTPAKSINCYTKKVGTFLPQFDDIITPCFRYEFSEKNSFIELTDEFIKNKEQLYIYTKHILKYLISP